MKIEYDYLIAPFDSKTSLEDFADKHGLTLLVGERTANCWTNDRFYARFKHISVKNKDGDGFCVVMGDGPTADEAICKYADAISGRTIVIDTTEKSHKEIQVPQLTYNHD